MQWLIEYEFASLHLVPRIYVLIKSIMNLIIEIAWSMCVERKFLFMWLYVYIALETESVHLICQCRVGKRWMLVSWSWVRTCVAASICLYYLYVKS